MKILQPWHFPRSIERRWVGDGWWVFCLSLWSLCLRETYCLHYGYAQHKFSRGSTQTFCLSRNTPSQGDLRRLKDFKLLSGGVCSLCSQCPACLAASSDLVSNDIHCLRQTPQPLLPAGVRGVRGEAECVCLTVKDFWRFEFPHKKFSKINIWKRKALFLQNYKNKVSSCFCLWMICSLWHEITLNKLRVLTRSVSQIKSYKPNFANFRKDYILYSQ